MSRRVAYLLCFVAAAKAQSYTTLVTFNGANGAAPTAPLIQATDGNFYGTTGSIMQPASGGTIFRMTPAGTLTTLYNLGYSNGSFPNGAALGGLVQGADGDFYGTAASGGGNGFGTIFKVTPSGVFTALYSFSGAGDGAYPGNLILASDGNFYGSTQGFVAPANIFRITPQGVFSKLYQFGSTPDNGQSANSLIRGRDGNLYGTTEAGGANGIGSVFKLTLGGTMTVLYNFGGGQFDLNSPRNMIQGSDGNFYGTTASGFVFKITPAGQLTVLSQFENPVGTFNPLIQASDGNFYGTTYGGGDTNRGVTFEVTPLGAFRVLFSFPYGGGYPTAGLVQGSDGNLYGTTSGVGFEGATEDDGTIFRVPLPSYTCTNATPPVITSVTSASAYGDYSYFAEGSWLEVKGTNLADPADPRLQAANGGGQWTAADFDGTKAPTLLDGIGASINTGGSGEAAYVAYLSPSQINVQVPGFYAAPSGTASITVTNCNATSAPFNLATRGLAPGFLAPPNFNVQGMQYLVATFASDGAYVLDTGVAATLGLTGRPAKPGDLIIAYGVGFGAVNPEIDWGNIVQQKNMLVNPITVSFGSTSATVGYQGLAGGFVGLYEFYISVPAGVANGNYQINVMQNGVPVPQTLYLTVHN